MSSAPDQDHRPPITRDDPGAPSKPRRRWLVALAMTAYGLVLLALCDLLYSNFLYTPDRPLRIPEPRYDHTLAARFDGIDRWGDTLYPVKTNSLGFKDATVRDVPAVGATRRILLIGDSFTEGIGLPFEQTFAGMLDAAGRRRSEPVEFLDAGVASYSATPYFRKVEALLADGLRFDEVVVFPDISDVPDEATSYFCLDDDPRWRAHCDAATAPRFAEVKSRKTGLQRNFVVIDATLKLIGMTVRELRPQDQKQTLAQWRDSPVPRWTVSNDPALFPPLGIEGGIARSLGSMQKLADMLASRGIPLTIVVYPWMTQLAIDDRDSRQVAIWRDFCVHTCKAFVDLFPAFFAEKAAHPDWYERLFIPGDFHFSAEGNRVVFDEVSKRLF